MHINDRHRGARFVLWFRLQFFIAKIIVLLYSDRRDDDMLSMENRKTLTNKQVDDGYK